MPLGVAFVTIRFESRYIVNGMVSVSRKAGPAFGLPFPTHRQRRGRELPADYRTAKWVRQGRSAAPHEEAEFDSVLRQP